MGDMISYLGLDLSLSVVCALIAVGIMFGLISTLVGGGSIISLPALLYLGISPHAANATNRVVGVTQTLSAAVHFWRRGAVDISSVKSLCGYAGLGGVLGALISLRLDPDALRTGIHLCLMFIALFTLFAPRRLFADRKEAAGRPCPTAPGQCWVGDKSLSLRHEYTS